ncbi:transcriptional repressor TCF25-domain-containing protein [Absidia repens]|uniref:Transcriptional repressor TCF25-domain-containing protein n=1 Tax=Absidia repens TaxID=90262 RepID=A0A1X2HYG5_9FUNG|nr:transcriptional repressor TCF25-domain-containing protein [Absidia repens]
MSSRALRRLQKEQLALVEQHSSGEESDEYEAPPKAKNLFDLLNEGDDAEEEEDDEEEEEVPQEDDTTVTSGNQPTTNKPKATSPPPPPTISGSSNKNKKNKKNKKKQQKKAAANNAKQPVAELSMKELDDMLDHMKATDTTTDSLANSSCATKTGVSNDPEASVTHASRQLLCVNYRYLDSDAEMKRMFGSRVVNREARPSGRLLKKTKLATPKVDWPSFQKQGLTMESLSATDNKGAPTTSFAFKHQEIYQDIQLDYLNVITQHDPNGLVMLTHQHPYHVDSLLQLSEIAKQQGDWTVAGDCIDRALYASERGFHPHFNLGSGNVRLPYQRSENRSFFIAMVRHIQFLTRRGCWRTAFEFNKLLFSLAPFADPTGALLAMDYYALSAREYRYVLEFGQTWQPDGETYPKDLLSLPNFAFSTAYAKFKCHQHHQTNVESLGDDAADEDNDADGSHMLRNAMAKFPGFVPQLLETLGESDATINQHISFFASTSTDNYLTLLLALYIHRTHELWKEPEVLSWFKSNAHHVLKDSSYHNKALTDLPCHYKTKEDDTSLPLNLCRHVLLLDQRELLSMLPRSVTNTTYYANDPLPPPDSTTGYDIDERMRTRRNNRRNETQQGGILAMLQGLLGARQLDATQRQQIRQAMDQFTAMTGNNGGDQIPGAFPGQDEEDDDDDEEISVTATVEDYTHTADDTSTSAPDHEDTDYTEEEWQRIQELLGRSSEAASQGNAELRDIMDSLGAGTDHHQRHASDLEDEEFFSDQEDLDLQRALAESAQEHQENMARRSQQ